MGKKNELSRDEQVEEDILEGIKQFSDNFFDEIIHDPPTFKYSPDIYSKQFYEELFRVLKKGGKLYHYSPLPHITDNFTANTFPLTGLIA
jgi:predicted methyltransferase